MSDLFGNHIVGFPHKAAQLLYISRPCQRWDSAAVEYIKKNIECKFFHYRT